MEIEVNIEEPMWTPYSGSAWWKCVQVRFENQTFIWQPTYKQLAEIFMKLCECEVQNRKIAEKRKEEKKR